MSYWITFRRRRLHCTDPSARSVVEFRTRWCLRLMAVARSWWIVRFAQTHLVAKGGIYRVGQPRRLIRKIARLTKLRPVPIPLLAADQLTPTPSPFHVRSAVRVVNAMANAKPAPTNNRQINLPVFMLLTPLGTSSLEIGGVCQGKDDRRLRLSRILDVAVLERYCLWSNHCAGSDQFFQRVRAQNGSSANSTTDTSCGGC